MDITLTVYMTESKTTIHLDGHQGTIEIYEANSPSQLSDQASLHFLAKDRAIFSISQKGKSDFPEILADYQLITITPPWDIELTHLEQLFRTEAAANGLTFEKDAVTEISIPEHNRTVLTSYSETVSLVLSRLGYTFQPQQELAPQKAKPAKARHKWTKEIGQMAFSLDTRESRATVLWQKRNEMLVKAGATMMKKPPLNKDGSLGFAARLGEKIREDNKEKIKNFTTTEDLILKSVNEVGLFLYFGGTNSWLEMVDADGKSLNAWTVVE